MATISRVPRRTLRSTIVEMRDVAQRDTVGRVALFVVWLGLALASGLTSTLQYTPNMNRRELI